MNHRASPLTALAFTTALLWSTTAFAQGLAPIDKSFLQQAAENGHAEVSAGRLALTKARNPKVRDFAQRMVDEHSKVGEELRTLAAAKQQELPTEPSMLQKGKEMIIAGLGDETFDRRYLNQMGVEATKSAIPLYEKTALESRDPEVKAFASKHLPALREQLQAAQDLKVSVDQRPASTK
jgi:putative membrane protein